MAQKESKRIIYNKIKEYIKILQENPEVVFMEFGTRRRFSRDWQEYVVRRFKEAVPNQITGTSNVSLAMKTGLAPRGTMAHELFMIMSGIMHGSDDEIRASHNQVLREWWDEYGYDLSIALTDTYGSEFFFNDFSKKQAEDWKGLRQDSGVPGYFLKKQLQFYGDRNIDSRKKIFAPSDGLELGKILLLHNQSRGKIIQLPGWGTNATNDMGLKTLTMVVKATESCGYGTVKLSDNPAKTMGKREDVKRFMKIFEYDPSKYQMEECKY